MNEAYARITDPDTSHKAANEVETSRLEQMVLVQLSSCPDGLTNHELVERTGCSWNTITPRLRPLVRKGLVVDSGTRRKGPTNKSCIVWRAI